MLAVVLGQGADRLGDDRVEDGQLLIGDPLPVGGEVNEDLAPVGGVGAPFGQPAAFEGVEQRGHAGAADEQPPGDDVPGDRLAGAVEDGEGLERAGRQPVCLASRALDLGDQCRLGEGQVHRDLAR